MSKNNKVALCRQLTWIIAPLLTKMLLNQREIDERENYLQRKCQAMIKFDFVPKDISIFERSFFSDRVEQLRLAEANSNISDKI